MSKSNDENDCRILAVNGLRPSEVDWALNHDAVHGIAYAFKTKALAKTNEWIAQNPGKAGMHAYGFVRALSREGLERISDDEERC